ncbi:GNAT family N-acetyltransferase [Flagellimonas meridianipacifica]|uniref:Ribosomal protein S18 acetylase RimI-like enzyme n=1 Tax=Flagellimonas meridianipacifica TaxID=1080225 RepID=A0A2T0MBJ0_9FLAO|nr:GNAT family N-acetyltransferase [Allomuricauda pacifica]PRX54871.1 ribosomal protein S18 acetylase RimI-like enzyme [Allomuricauda pacifica]
MEQIRQAKKGDATLIAMLGRTTFNEAFGHLFHSHDELKTYLSATFSIEKIENSLEKENNVYWIAFVDRLPVGYAKLKLRSPSNFIRSTNISQLQKIYVLKDFLSLKIGRHLQDQVFATAVRSGAKDIWLSVWQGNQRAIRFYEKNAFKNVGNHQFTIGTQTFDFMIMSKRLNHG